jgi:ribose/xylose/arabinose/galactoside ABC-type transport system permease subunit
VLLIAVALFFIFSVFLRGFLSPGNLITLVRGVSTLGILGVGMAILVIGGGIDLEIVAIYAMSAAWTLHPCQQRRVNTARHVARISVRPVGRSAERRVDRLFGSASLSVLNRRVERQHSSS